MPVPTPSFPAGTLDDNGFPVWITDLAARDDPNHTVHVVRGLAPADALQVVGARPGVITPCQLPARQPHTSLPRAAIGPTDSGSVLLAGQIGPWTFVYDDMGLTSFGEDPDGPAQFAPPAKMLSAGGREAATSTLTINADTDLAYSVDGDLLLHATEGVDPAGDDVPAGLRAAIDAAGNFRSADSHDGKLDCGMNMRVLCALAGLNVTLDDLRQIPLLAAPFS
jgi:hypothetical protein